MPRITFIEADGRTCDVDADTGSTLMEVAVSNGIEGILADCGGAMACATCHCYLDEEKFAGVEAASATESAMLEDLDELRPTSRLSCQIVVTEDLDGARIDLPAAQY